MIAHRLKSVRGADRISASDKWQIVQCGTPGELMKKTLSAVILYAVGCKLQMQK